MRALQDMLRTHPRGASGIDMQALNNCLAACHECEATCTSCADACLSERQVEMLRRCIRLNLDCADICAATGKVLTRLTEPDGGFLGEQVHVMAAICRICAEECERHAGEHEHCRICAETCRRCEQACQRLAQGLHAGSPR